MPGENYHNAQTVNYVCPFFMSEKGNVISCEGYTAASRNKTCFLRKKQLERYREKYCFGYTYRNCPWAEVLLRKKYRVEE